LLRAIRAPAAQYRTRAVKLPILDGGLSPIVPSTYLINDREYYRFVNIDHKRYKARDELNLLSPSPPNLGERVGVRGL